MRYLALALLCAALLAMVVGLLVVRYPCHREDGRGTVERCR